MLPIFTRVRTRLIAVILLAVLVPLVSTAIYGNWVTSRIIEDKVKSTTAYDLRLRAGNFTAGLNDLQHQVLSLTQLPSMLALLEARARADAPAIARWKERLAADCLAATKMHPSFYQVRYLAEDGQEWVRINSDGKEPFIVPARALQSKADRYYFTEAMQIPPGTVYISPIDLNQELGYIETPFVPVIRYAAPLFYSDGGRAGIVIVNIFAQSLLEKVAVGSDGGRRLALVDQHGYYLTHPEVERTWGGPNDLNTGHGLKRDYPQLWRQIVAGKEGLLHINERGGEAVSGGHIMSWGRSLGIGVGKIIQHMPVAPIGANVPQWFILDEQPAGSLFAPLWSFRFSAATILAIAVVGAILMAVGLSYSLTRPLLALREGVRRLQRGERHQPIAIGSRDEIQELATAFNEMAVVLQLRLQQLAQLNQAGYQIAAQTAKSSVLEAIAKEARSLVDAEYCVVSLKEKPSSPLSVVIGSGNGVWAALRHKPEVRQVLEEALQEGLWRETVLGPVGGPAGYLCCAPLLMGSQGKGLLELYGPNPELRSAATGNLLATLAAGASIALGKAELYQKLVDHQAQLHALVERLVTVQEEERRIVAYEIHDSLVQTLVGIRLHMSNFVALRKDAPIEADALLRKGLEGLATAIVEARRIIEGLRPTVLDDLGLVAALRQHIEGLEKEMQWQAHFRASPANLRAPAAVETTAFRIAQEALSNARRHAAASRVTVDLAAQDGHLILDVCDNGKGFDPQQVKDKGRGLGLASMRERAELLGGRCLIESAAGRGTRVRAELPLNVETV